MFNLMFASVIRINPVCPSTRKSHIWALGDVPVPPPSLPRTNAVSHHALQFVSKFDRSVVDSNRSLYNAMRFDSDLSQID